MVDLRAPSAPRKGPPSSPGLPTRQQLDDQSAEASELRQQLDDLRRRLDVPPLPPAPPRPRRSVAGFRPGRRAALGALVVGGTLGVVATGVLVPWSQLSPTAGTDAGRVARPAPVAAPLVSGSGTGPGAGPVAGAPAPRSAPAGTLPASGPGVDRPGTVMVVRARADGSLDVVEQVVLGPRGLRQVQLHLPSLDALGGAVARLRPGVSRLRVAVNDTPVRPVVAGAGWVVPTGTARARTVRLSYRLDGVRVPGRHSDAGRTLAVVVPLAAQALREQGLPLVVRAAGPQVRGVTCPGAPAREMLCGTPDAVGWSAAVPASATIPALLVQLTR